MALAPDPYIRTPGKDIRQELFIALLLGLVIWLFVVLGSLPLGRLSGGVLVFGLFGVLVFGLFHVLGIGVLFLMLLFMLLVALVIGLVAGLVSVLFLGLFLVLFLVLGVMLGGGLGDLDDGLVVDGAKYLQSYSLRYLLWGSGAMPWHYVRFLEEATERILLQRVGGGYRFIHPLFQEYFASLGTGTSTSTQSSSSSPQS